MDNQTDRPIQEEKGLTFDTEYKYIVHVRAFEAFRNLLRREDGIIIPEGSNHVSFALTRRLDMKTYMARGLIRSYSIIRVRRVEDIIEEGSSFLVGQAFRGQSSASVLSRYPLGASSNGVEVLSWSTRQRFKQSTTCAGCKNRLDEQRKTAESIRGSGVEYQYTIQVREPGLFVTLLALQGVRLEPQGSASVRFRSPKLLDMKVFKEKGLIRSYRIIRINKVKKRRAAAVKTRITPRR